MTDLETLLAVAREMDELKDKLRVCPAANYLDLRRDATSASQAASYLRCAESMVRGLRERHS